MSVVYAKPVLLVQYFLCIRPSVPCPSACCTTSLKAYISGGTVDISCKCNLATPLQPVVSSRPQSTKAYRPSILLTPSRKRLSSDINRPRSANKVVRIKPDSQEEPLNEGALDGRMTARKSTSGKLDVCLPKFRRFRRQSSLSSTPPPVGSVASSNLETIRESQNSSSVTESSRESSAETSTSNETIEVRSPDSPNIKSPTSPPPPDVDPTKESEDSVDPIKELEDSKKPRPARFAAPKFEPIPLRTRSAIGKQPRPVGRPRRHTSDQGKPVEFALRRVDLDNVIPQRRRPASVSAATELQQTRFQRLTPLWTEDEDDEEKQLAAVIALSAVEVQNPPKRTEEADKNKAAETKDSMKDCDVFPTSGKDSVMLINTRPISPVQLPQQPNPIHLNPPPNPIHLNPPPNPIHLNPPPNPKPALEQPRRLLARKSAGPQVKLEEVCPEINNIREVPIYHTCTDTYGVFYVHLYYKPVHPCVLCLKCKETLATFQFATHSHSNDPKRCSTKKWRHCVRLRYPDNKEHEVIFQRLKDRFGHKNPRGSGGGKKSNPDNPPFKDAKKQKKKKTTTVDIVDYLPYPSIVVSQQLSSKVVWYVGQVSL